LIDFSIPVETRIRAIEMYYKYYNTEIIEVLKRLISIFNFSLSVVVKEYIQKICVFSEIPFMYRLEIAKDLCFCQDMDDCFMPLDIICNDLKYYNDIPTPKKTEAVCVLMRRKKFKENATRYFFEILDNQSIDPEYRYRMITSLKTTFDNRKTWATKDEKLEIDQVLSRLHGIKGLESVITYKIQTKPVPLAFDFEYKPAILKKYGRIFQKENISKYSGKIANICSILEKSTGIVLIYSKYIEGGLIPMALALEEMGFSRYGYANHTRSLFKNAPSPLLNPLTMKPKTASETETAKYVMITGQKMYSPNNNLDLKLVTDSSNKYGEKVKVVLISEAGSEGLDFKNIRQVHILDPWYNMNRLEQIIGRAVRNKSHCGLPFEERNVEIYMHGTYLDAEQETADMYLYRLAERKAITIGKVTRLLKETAVDCLLNIDQTNFTESKMGQTVSLVLSTDKKPIEFPVGDKPFTNMCDYMETCEFKCSPSTSIPKNEIEPNTYTYGSYYLQNSHDRISKRIRQLFREKSFYSWKDLKTNITIVKPYPLEQIYYTLSVFLQNNNEWLVDRHGRKGYMVQRKDIYAFQPIEIGDERASIFERTNPIEQKKHSLSFLLPKTPIDIGQTRPSISQKKITNHKENENIVTTTTQVTYDNILSELEKNINIVLDKESYIKPANTDMNWYKYAKLSVRVLVQKHNIPRIDCIKHVVFHFLDTLTVSDKIIIVNSLFLDSTTILSETIPEITETMHITEMLRIYFLEKMYREKKEIVILLGELSEIENKNKFFKFDPKMNRWNEDTNPSFEIENWAIEKFDIRTKLVDKVNAEESSEFKKDQMESNIGFIGIRKNERVFKLKNLRNKRPQPGAACFQADKKELIQKVNDFLEINGRNDKSELYSDDPYFLTNIIERPNLCVIYELLMRHFTTSSTQIWFLSLEQMIQSDLDKFILTVQETYGVKTFFLKNVEPKNKRKI
jgi:hypothetical protein